MILFRTLFLFLLFSLVVRFCDCQPLFPERFRTLGSNSISGLPDNGLFGTSVAPVGDIDGDGIGDIAVGSRDDGGTYNGGLRLIYLDAYNNVKSSTKLPSLGAAGTVFGYSVRAIGDLDGDGVGDLAVGALYDGAGGYMYGAVYILFMNPGGTIKSSQKISALQGNFSHPLVELSSLGSSIASLGDLDGDGNVDIAVGAYRDNGGQTKTGSVYILFLNADGTVKTSTKISGNLGGLNATLSFEGYSGVSVANIGDLDNDGVVDLAVGSHRWDAGATDAGSVWILFLQPDGTVKDHHVIDNASGDLPSALHAGSLFGTSVEGVPDINGDGVEDILVGTMGDNALGANTGALWVLLMNEDGTVADAYELSATSGNTNIVFASGDGFGACVAYLGMNDGLLNLAIGAIRADEGGPDRGLVWITAVCPQPIVNAGADSWYCDGRTTINLNAEPPGGVKGFWYVLRGGATVVSSSDPKSIVTDLSKGENDFVWTVSTPLQGCPALRDTVSIYVESPPVAGKDTVLCRGRTTYPLNASLSGLQIGTWQILWGGATLSDPNDPRAEFTALSDSVRLRWTVHSAFCPTISDEISVRTWEVKPENFPNVITPGDHAGKNDVWIVRHLEDLPGEKILRIFNRWGTLVYCTRNYENDWSGEGLSAGEYYYRMAIPSCEADVKGWIHVIK